MSILPATQGTRWHELVAANDRGYVPATLDLGATKEEVNAIGAGDRKAQGVTRRKKPDGYGQDDKSRQRREQRSEEVF